MQSIPEIVEPVQALLSDIFSRTSITGHQNSFRHVWRLVRQHSRNGCYNPAPLFAISFPKSRQNRSAVYYFQPNCSTRLENACSLPEDGIVVVVSLKKPQRVGDDHGSSNMRLQRQLPHVRPNPTHLNA
jgi:hypothetical protein